MKTTPPTWVSTEQNASQGRATTMRYIYLTSEFLGSGATLRTLVKATPHHELVRVLVSARRRGLSYLWKTLRRSGLRYLIYLLAIGFGYRVVQTIVVFISRFSAQPRRKCSVVDVASRLCIPVDKVERISSPEVLAAINELAPDLIVSVFWDQRIPAGILRIPSLGSINVHNSLLPEFAGCAPTIAALATGREAVGATVHLMNEEFDAGHILEQRHVLVESTDTVLGIEAKVLQNGVEALISVMKKLRVGFSSYHRQDLAKRSYYSHPTRKVIHQLSQQGRQLLRWREFIGLSLDTLDINQSCKSPKQPNS